MKGLFILLGCFLASLVTLHLIAAAIFGGMALFIAVIIFTAGGFQTCPKCGSHLTTQEYIMTPDASYGNRILHERVVQKCWNSKCRKIAVLRGIMIK